MGRGRRQYQEGYALDDFVAGEGEEEVDNDALSVQDAEDGNKIRREPVVEEAPKTIKRDVGSGSKIKGPTAKAKMEAELLDELIGPETDEEETFSASDDQSDFELSFDSGDDDDGYQSELSEYESDRSVRKTKKGKVASKEQPAAATRAKPASSQAAAPGSVKGATAAHHGKDNSVTTNATRSRANASFMSSKPMLAPPLAAAPPKQRLPPPAENKAKKGTASNLQLNLPVNKPKQTRNQVPKGTIKPRKEAKPSAAVETVQPTEASDAVGQTYSDAYVDDPNLASVDCEDAASLHLPSIAGPMPTDPTKEKRNPSHEHANDKAFQTSPHPSLPPPVAKDPAQSHTPPMTPPLTKPPASTPKESVYARLKRSFGMYNVDSDGLAKPNQSEGNKSDEDNSCDDSLTLKAAKLDWDQYYV